MNAKHTKGPWEVTQPCFEVKSDPLFWQQGVKSGGKRVAVASGVGQEEAQANAALIAAAPELLEACKQAQEHFKLAGDPIQNYYAEIIARAEGRT